MKSINRPNWSTALAKDIRADDLLGLQGNIHLCLQLLGAKVAEGGLCGLQLDGVGGVSLDGVAQVFLGSLHLIAQLLHSAGGTSTEILQLGDLSIGDSQFIFQVGKIEVWRALREIRGCRPFRASSSLRPVLCIEASLQAVEPLSHAVTETLRAFHIRAHRAEGGASGDLLGLQGEVGAARG